MITVDKMTVIVQVQIAVVMKKKKQELKIHHKRKVMYQEMR